MTRASRQCGQVVIDIQSASDIHDALPQTEHRTLVMMWFFFLRTVWIYIQATTAVYPCCLTANH